MNKDDWIGLLYALVMGILAAGIVYVLMLPKPPQHQYILKIEYTTQEKK